MPDYRTLSVERDIAQQLLEVKAKATLKAKRRVTLSQVIREALAVYVQHLESLCD